MRNDLFRAVHQGDCEILRQCLEGGADPNAADPTSQDGNRLLHEAVLYNNPDVATELLKRGANVNAANGPGDTPLHYAALFDSFNSCGKNLLQCGADVNAAGWGGNRPLHYAAYSGDKDCVHALLDNGADPRVKNDDDQTPQQVALANKHPEIASILREAQESTALRINPPRPELS